MSSTSVIEPSHPTLADLSARWDDEVAQRQPTENEDVLVLADADGSAPRGDFRAVIARRAEETRSRMYHRLPLQCEDQAASARPSRPVFSPVGRLDALFYAS